MAAGSFADLLGVADIVSRLSKARRNLARLDEKLRERYGRAEI